MTDNKSTHHFQAVLTPNRSLSPKGFAVIMACVGLVSFAAGVMFVRMGAWPVFGFFGLDVALLYWAFKRNYSDGDIRELIEVTPSELIIQRFNKDQKTQELKFLRNWVRLNLAEDKAREIIGALTVQCHGKTTEIGHFLGPDERKEFFLALRRALMTV